MAETATPGNPIDIAEIRQVRAEAECLFTQAQVDAAIDEMAVAIRAKLAEKNPLVLAVLVGGMVPAGLLLPKLDFPLQVDYIHATRYRGETSGSELHWIKAPGELSGRDVLIIDDILDQGLTLAAIVEACYQRNAAKVWTAVLADKQVPRKGDLQQADFTGVTIPDRYVFGGGMDYKNYLRDAPGIFAVKGL